MIITLLSDIRSRHLICAILLTYLALWLMIYNYIILILLVPNLLRNDQGLLLLTCELAVEELVA